jgi:hypothetical protein
VNIALTPNPEKPEEKIIAATFPSINGLFCPDLRSPRVFGCGIQEVCRSRKPLCGLDPEKNAHF